MIRPESVPNGNFGGFGGQAGREFRQAPPQSGNPAWSGSGGNDRFLQRPSPNASGLDGSVPQFRGRDGAGQPNIQPGNPLSGRYQVQRPDLQRSQGQPSNSQLPPPPGVGRPSLGTNRPGTQQPNFDRPSTRGDNVRPRNMGQGFGRTEGEGPTARPGQPTQEALDNFLGNQQSTDRPTTRPGRPDLDQAPANRPDTTPPAPTTDSSLRPSDRGSQPDLGNRSDVGERPERGDLPNADNRPEAGDRPSDGIRPGYTGRPGRGDRPDSIDRPDNSANRPDRGDRPDGVGDRPEFGNRPERGDNDGQLGDRPNAGNRGDAERTRPTWFDRVDRDRNQDRGERGERFDGLNGNIHQLPNWVDNNRRGDIGNRWSDALTRADYVNWYDRHPSRRARWNFWGNNVRNNWNYQQPGYWFSNIWWDRHFHNIGGWHYRYSTYNYGPSYWWRVPTYRGIVDWCAWSNAPTVWTQPVYYDYGPGGNVYYDDNRVFVNGEVVGTPQEFAASAAVLATVPPPPDEQAAEAAEWLPLGTFAVSNDEKGSATGLTVQLAINKQGIISGTLYNEETDNADTLLGQVDQDTQRVALRVGESETVIMETGLYNLTLNECPVMIHFGPEKVEYWLLVRIEYQDEAA